MTIKTRLEKLELLRQGPQKVKAFIQDDDGETFHTRDEPERHYTAAELDAISAEGVLVVKVVYASMSDILAQKGGDESE